MRKIVRRFLRKYAMFRDIPEAMENVMTAMAWMTLANLISLFVTLVSLVIFLIYR
jgi:hypothetical protein